MYGYRVHGPWDPARGFRFNPAKVLLDPYARAIGRPVSWHASVFAFASGTEGDGAPATNDSAPYAPLGVVTQRGFDWHGDRGPACAVARDRDLRSARQGLDGAASRCAARAAGHVSRAWPRLPSFEHLQTLGVTTVELMPMHAHVDEHALVERGLTNYWGYNTIGYFAPDTRFAVSRDPLDVADGIQDDGPRRCTPRASKSSSTSSTTTPPRAITAGPTLSFRGIDNTSYYRLQPGRPSRYEDFTGTGNTLNMQSPHVLQLMMDSLRYWVEDMHVDGFRFDLASALARELHAVDRLSSFFDVIQQDPVISRVKLIAEPWDVGEGGYQVGNFPPGWTEWNGKYRDAVRRFWRGDSGTLPELATRLAGSSDLYGSSGRQPHASVNFVTAHDGFTLADLVSLRRQKHNEANGEDNRDGESNNLSFNCGVEGPSIDPGVVAAAPASAAQLPGDADRLAGRADDFRRRRAGTQPVR